MSLTYRSVHGMQYLSILIMLNCSCVGWTFKVDHPNKVWSSSTLVNNGQEFCAATIEHNTLLY